MSKVPLGKIGGALGDLWNLASSYKTDKGITRDFTAVYKVLQGLTAVVVKFIIAVLWFIGHLSSAVSDIDVNAKKISADIDDLVKDQQTAWTTLLNDKLPGDLQALYDALDTEAPAAKAKQQAQKQVDLGPLEKRVTALESWRNKTVTPALKDFNTFLTDWRKTYLPPVRTLIRWLASPTTFAQWASVPLLQAMPSTMRRPASKQYVRQVNSALLATWSDDPDGVLNALFAVMEQDS